VQELIVRWLSPLYRDGLAIIGRAADSSGWSADEVPHIGLGLFGLVFAYFVNGVGTQRLSAGGDDPLGPSALAIQRRFLEEAILRLLAPREATRGRTARRRSSHG
jgi:hypothetical protein